MTSDIEAKEPPKPPAGYPPEIFEWDYLIKAAINDQEKMELTKLKALNQEALNFVRQKYKTKVDWSEFSGKVPKRIVVNYKKAYDNAVKDAKSGKFDFVFDRKDWEKKTEEMLKVVREVEVETRARMTELDSQIEKIEARLNRLGTATIDEELALDPELAKRVDEEVSKELEYEQK